MTSPEDRRTLLEEVARAHAAGARLSAACAEAGIDPRTRQRWRAGTDAAAGGDCRKFMEWPAPLPLLV
ncbi:protein of unknown function [Rhodovastum atsumiense]|nr:protein of unknown function [Rhodovastum atsumiense]